MSKASTTAINPNGIRPFSLEFIFAKFTDEFGLHFVFSNPSLCLDDIPAVRHRDNTTNIIVIPEKKPI